MKTEETFYLVWQQTGQAPTVKHRHEHEAKHEALRLAKLNPGLTFTVLQAVESVLVAEPVTWIKHQDEVPF